MKDVHIHKVSDSTGETVNQVARAALVQFDHINPTEHGWLMIRNQKQVEEALEGIRAKPGFVLYTLVDETLRKSFEDGCRALNVPAISPLDHVVGNMGRFFGEEIHALPGRQHVMNEEYFDRIEAIHYVMAHDDGQMARDLNSADVILLGVSRTSKTPTCIYLANRGIKAANIPIVPGCPLPPELMETNNPLIVGLTKDPGRLVMIRRNRLKMLNQNEETDYVDPRTVKEEVTSALKLYAKNDWPVIDVSRKSIEEVAATIIHLLSRRQEEGEA